MSPLGNYCRACGHRWLTFHHPGCSYRTDAEPYVLTHHCVPPRMALGPWPVDRRGRTAPHGDKVAA